LLIGIEENICSVNRPAAEYSRWMVHRDDKGKHMRNQYEQVMYHRAVSGSH